MPASLRTSLLITALLLCLARCAAETPGPGADGKREKLTAKAVLRQASVYDEAGRHIKRTQGATLAYVTPWNNLGYDIAKLFAAKFTYVSPVWYNLERRGASVEITGGHDVDQGWLRDVRAPGASAAPLIVPRFYLRPGDELAASEWPAVTAALVAECRRQRYDGAVLDVGYAARRAFASGELAFLLELAAALHQHALRFILVIPVPPMFTAENLLALVDHVDAFSLMTYDFRTPSGQALLALLPPALRGSAQAGKVLLGANLYGYDYADGEEEGRAVVGREYLELLEAHKASAKFSWDREAHEHRLSYKRPRGAGARAEPHQLYYPTVQSVADRLALAESMGVGLSLWEIGQGLHCFYDLL